MLHRKKKTVLNNNEFIKNFIFAKSFDNIKPY